MPPACLRAEDTTNRLSFVRRGRIPAQRRNAHETRPPDHRLLPLQYPFSGGRGKPCAGEADVPVVGFVFCYLRSLLARSGKQDRTQIALALFLRAPCLPMN